MGRLHGGRNGIHDCCHCASWVGRISRNRPAQGKQCASTWVVDYVLSVGVLGLFKCGDGAPDATGGMDENRGLADRRGKREVPCSYVCFLYQQREICLERERVVEAGTTRCNAHGTSSLRQWSMVNGPLWLSL